MEGVFGRHCEYELYIGSTLDETTRHIQVTNQKDALWGQLQRRRMCYTAIDCEYGLLCLDWRNICDGNRNIYLHVFFCYFSILRCTKLS